MVFDPSAKVRPLDDAEREAILVALRAALAREQRVRVAFLFGSFARGEPFRDIDIGIELDEPFRLLEVAGVHTRLLDALEGWGVELDVVPINDAPPSFRRQVADTGIVLFERFEGDAFELAVQAQSDEIAHRIAREASLAAESSK